MGFGKMLLTDEMVSHTAQLDTFLELWVSQDFSAHSVQSWVFDDYLGVLARLWIIFEFNHTRWEASLKLFSMFGGNR